jgi:hypothetical protein
MLKYNIKNIGRDNVLPGQGYSTALREVRDGYEAIVKMMIIKENSKKLGVKPAPLSFHPRRILNEDT